MALVSKILEATLTAGSTMVTFTDTDIPNSLIRVFSSDSDIIPESRVLSGNSLTVTYPAQSNNIGVALEIVKQGLDIVDNVTSEDASKALSAKQGKVLKDAIDSIIIPTIPENITDLDDVNVSDIQSGQVLAWNSSTEKFVNVDQSGGGSTEIIKAAWTATASTAAYTQLTEAKTLNAGKYLINIHNAYSTSTNINQFCLLINNTADLTTISNVSISYGNSTFLIELPEASSVCFATASALSMSWDNQYLSRGGMNILKIG